MSDLFDVLIPTIILGMLCKGVLEVLLGGKKRRTPEKIPETPGETTLPDYGTTEQEGSIKPYQRENPAEKFNRALRKHEQEKLAQQADKVYDESKPQSAKQRIHRDDEPVHETKGRIIMTVCHRPKVSPLSRKFLLFMIRVIFIRRINSAAIIIISRQQLLLWISLLYNPCSSNSRSRR